MRVAFLGFVTAVEEYRDKRTQEVIRNASVASTNQMMRVRLLDGQDFAEMDSVLVCGDLKVFERNFYVENPVMRLSTQEDRQFMQGVPVQAGDGPGRQDMRALPKDAFKDGEKVGVK